jgi:hypothetical protein
MLPQTHILKIYLILYSHLRLCLPCGLSPSGFTTETLYAPLISPIRATCLAHLILLDFITRTIVGEQYRSLSSSLCSFLHSRGLSSLLSPNYPLLTSYQTDRPHQRFCGRVPNMVGSYGEEFFSNSPNSQVRGHPLVGCPRMLIQCIRSYPPY